MCRIIPLFVFFLPVKKLASNLDAPSLRAPKTQSEEGERGGGVEPITDGQKLHKGEEEEDGEEEEEDGS